LSDPGLVPRVPPPKDAVISALMKDTTS